VFEVNEGSTAYLSVTFLDKAGAAQEPLSVTYRVHEMATGAQIRAETSVTPGATVEIALAPADNVVLHQAALYETHVVTVVGTYGASDAVQSQCQYRVRNLRVVTS
jgi:hypothetical protein